MASTRLLCVVVSQYKGKRDLALRSPMVLAGDATAAAADGRLTRPDLHPLAWPAAPLAPDHGPVLIPPGAPLGVSPAAAGVAA